MYKLLVVDDEPLVREGIVSLVPFEKLGINEIFQAENGLKALEIVIKEFPDIILCDINMPKMNGLEFASKVKDLYPNTKIAFISGYDYFDYAKEGIKIGVEDYILKPISSKDVFILVSKMIDKINQERYQQELLKSIKSDNNIEDDFDYQNQIDNYLNGNYNSSKLSLSSLANELGLSEGYLSNLFKKIYKKSFTDYITELRLKKAKILLLTSHLKNYEIAEAVGINDPNYFSTTFKKKYGYSPSQYRKKVIDEI
jgi:two-component system response regulator YesN